MNKVACAILAVMAISLFSGGCAPVPAFPDTIDVSLDTAGTTQTAAADTGPSVLAGSTWAGYAKEASTGQPETPGSSVGPYGGLTGLALTEPHQADDLLVRVTFGDDGRVLRFFDNHLYTRAIIPELIVDGQLHPGGVPLVTYAQRSYGFSIGNRFGLAAPIHVYLSGTEVASGLAYAWGQIDGNRLDGRIGYATSLTLPLSPVLFGADEFPFYALRED